MKNSELIRGYAADHSRSQTIWFAMKLLGMDASKLEDGGPGSGNFGHKGRPGQRGGSGKGGGSAGGTGSSESESTSSNSGSGTAASAPKVKTTLSPEMVLLRYNVSGR